MSKRARLFTGVFLTAALLVLAWIPWSRYTTLGIFMGGGGKYWVHRAASAPSDAEAAQYLQRVLHTTQYGVNIVENAVAGLPHRDDRVRMWRVLIGLAPNDIWRATYSRRLASETASGKPSGT